MKKRWVNIKSRLLSGRPFVFVLLFAGLGTVLLIVSFASPANQHGPKKETKVDARDIARQKSNAATAKLMSQSPRLQMAALDLRHNSGKKASLGPKLKELAGERKQNLMDLIKNDPASARQFVLSDKALATLRENGADVEQPATITGVFGFKQFSDDTGDHLNGQVTTPDNKTYIINDDHVLSHISYGSTIKVVGHILDDQFLLAAKPNSGEPSQQTFYAADASDPNAQPASTQPVTVVYAASVSPTTGPIVDAVMFANFSGGATPTVDVTKLKALYNGTPGKDLVAFVTENSYGKASLAVDYYEFGDFPGIPCSDLSAQVQAMKSALAAQTTKQYQVYTYLTNCNGYGFASRVGNNPPSVVLGNYYTFFPHAHELSHTLGSFLGHGGYLDCGLDVFIPPQNYTFEDKPCVGQEYSDHYDTLANGIHGEHLSASHKLDPGWLDSTQVNTVTSLGTTSYTLSPYETNNGLLALKIPRGNSGMFYTLEYRQKLGFDANFQSGCFLCNADQGGLLRLAGYGYWGPGGGADSNIIDMTPESTKEVAIGYWPADDGYDGTLLPGKSYTDSEYGITIKVVSIDTAGLHVEVTLNSVCIRANPTTTPLSPASQTAKPGESKTYSFTVTNNDSSGCPQSDFRYTPYGGEIFGAHENYLRSQVTSIASPAYWTLAPGASKVITLTVNTSVNTPDGSYGMNNFGNAYPFGSVLSSAYGTTGVEVQGAKFVVSSGTDTVAPSQPTNLTAKVLGAGAATLVWTPSSDNTAVVGYKIIVNNSGVLSSSQPGIFLTNLLPGTAYSYNIQAVDRAGNYSTGADVSFTTPAKTDTIAPTSVGKTTVTASDHGLNIAWQQANDNVGVLYYLYTSFGYSCKEPVAFVDWAVTDCDVPNIWHRYPSNERVIAVDADGNTSNIFDIGSEDLKTALVGDAQTPTKPSGVYVSSVTNATGATISWQPSTDNTGVTGYNVYRGASKIGFTTNTSYADTAAKNGGAYRIQAVDTEGSVSQFSETAVANGSSTSPNQADTIAPSANIVSPVNNATVSGSVTVTASATDNTGITMVEYQLDGVYLGQVSTPPYSLTLDTTKYADGIHELLVIAYDKNSTTNCCYYNYGSAGPSTIIIKNRQSDSASPSTPSALNATAPSAGQVNLIWTASTDNSTIIRYDVLRDGQKIGDVLGNGYTDLTVLPNTTYTYQIVAIDTSGNASVASTGASVKTGGVIDTSPPSQPTGLTATPVSSNQINISWTASTDNIGVAGYDVYRNGTKIISVTSTSYGDTGLNPGTTYGYYIIAKDSAGNPSSASVTVSATTQSVTTPPSTAGTIQGVVTDSAGTALPGTTVSVTFGGSKHSYTTDSLGRYTITGIPSGSYTLKFTKKGYTGKSLTITISAGQTITQNVALAKSGKQ